MHLRRKKIKAVSLASLMPLLPLALLVGTFATAVRALMRVRSLERMITAPEPS